MHLVFGCNLDGLVYPEHANGKAGSFDQAVCGPLSFLTHLETILGVRQPPVVKALRTAQYMRLLKVANDGSQFFSASLSADAWTTAAFLLGVRDELIASGWNAAKIPGFEKLNQLAELEGEEAIAHGFGERLNLVFSKLRALNFDGTQRRLPLSKLSLVEPKDILPPVWARLIELLESMGVLIEQLEQKPAASEDSDLRRLQEKLLSFDFSSKVSLRGDGTLTIIDSIEEAQAAHLAASWLAQSNESEGTVIIRGSDCSALSHACQSMSLPSLGPNSRGHFRAILQVLPLAFKLACRPLDPNTMIEFINLPGGPIPNWIGNKLLAALSDSPGIGGKAWQSAWDSCTRDQSEWTGRDFPKLSLSEKEEIAKSKIEKFRVWFDEFERCSSNEISSKEAEQICLRLEKWAAERAPNDENRLLYELAAGQSKLLRQIISTCREESFALSQLQKMIESVNSYGATISTAEAASWTIVDKPGQIWATADKVLWWGFAEHNISPLKTTIWSDAELQILRQNNIYWESPVQRLRRETGSWRWPILNACSRLILVKPHMVAGRRASTHPVWDELKVRIDDNSIKKISLDPVTTLSTGRTQVAGVELTSIAIDPIHLPSPLRTWQIPNVQIKGRAKESYSSIERLLGCSLSWVLQYNAGMWASRSFSIPQKQLLLGKLAHAVVNELFEKKKHWSPDDAETFARHCVSDLLPKMAAALLLPGSAPQLREAKEVIPQSVRQLVTFLDDAGVEVDGSETTMKAPFVNGNLSGIIDLLVRLPDGSPAVLDFKWSLSPYFYRKRIVEGRALQLAIYSWLVNESKSNVADFSKMKRKRETNGDAADQGASAKIAETVGSAATPLPPAGFYMFRHGELFFTQDGVFPSYTFVRKMQRDLPETFELTLAAYLRALEELNAGKAIASGVFDETVDVLAPASLVEPPCNFCKLSHFCGVKELK